MGKPVITWLTQGKPDGLQTLTLIFPEGYEPWERIDVEAEARWLRIFMRTRVVGGWQARTHFGLKLLGGTQ